MTLISQLQADNHYNLLSTEDINNLEVISFEGEILYIDSDEKLKNIKLPNDELVGFDTETKPSFKKNIKNHLSLIQIATENKAFLFHLKQIKDKSIIIKYLNNPEITKIGAGIADDIKKINEISNIEILKNSFVDLQFIAKQMNLPRTNLRFLSAYFLNKRIIKSSQTSNWDKYPLSPKQMLYAATDAWICLKIYKIILKTKTKDY